MYYQSSSLIFSAQLQFYKLIVVCIIVNHNNSHLSILTVGICEDALLFYMICTQRSCINTCIYQGEEQKLRAFVFCWVCSFFMQKDTVSTYITREPLLITKSYTSNKNDDGSINWVCYGIIIRCTRGA